MKNLKPSLAFIYLLSQLPLAGQPDEGASDLSVSSIAFGSCSDQSNDRDQLWKKINRQHPDLWIWLGDNVYADTEDMVKLKADYDKQKSHPGYQRLLASTRVVGIWDDHDYGVNDGGKEYPKKEESKQIMLNFMGVEKDHPVHLRSGAYQAYSFRSEGKKIKCILLDTRYFRDPLVKDEKGQNAPNMNGGILGDEQWSWLERQLQESAELIILVSSIQVVAGQHHFEKWANFPRQREKLFSLIASTTDTPLVIISGDRHIAEVSKIEIEGYPYPVHDITSSSLTRPFDKEQWDTKNPEPNKFRVGSLIYPANYGLMNIHWDNDKPVISLMFLGKKNKGLEAHTLSFD